MLVWLSQIRGLRSLFLKFLWLCVYHFFLSSDLDIFPSFIFENPCSHPPDIRPKIRQWKSWQFPNIFVETISESLTAFLCIQWPLGRLRTRAQSIQHLWGQHLPVMLHREWKGVTLSSLTDLGYSQLPSVYPSSGTLLSSWHPSYHLIIITTLWSRHYFLV